VTTAGLWTYGDWRRGYGLHRSSYYQITRW